MKNLQTKTLSISFTRKWCKSLEFNTTRINNKVYCKVSLKKEKLLGHCPTCESKQEYPDLNWCQNIEKKLGGRFSQSAIIFLCENITHKIEYEIAKQEVIDYINKDTDPFGLISISKLIEDLTPPTTCSVSSKVELLKKAIVLLRVSSRIEMRTTKKGVAKSLGVELVDFNGVKYGFLKKLQEKI
jgi:hypothetical protein